MKKVLLVVVLCFLITGCKYSSDLKVDNHGEETLDHTEDAVIVHHNTSEEEDFFLESANLTQKTINDLFVLGKVWGYLKYYHPNVAKGEFNWDEKLFEVIPEVLHTNSNKERDTVLSIWISSLGDFVEEENKQEITNEIKMSPDLEWITSSNLEEDLVKQLLSIKNVKRENENHYIVLHENVGNPIFQNEVNYYASYPKVEHRLLSLYRYWNIIEYFFPYKYLIDEDWDDVLVEFIPKMIGNKDDLEYQLTVLELMARIHDTHANIWSQHDALEKFWGEKFAPIIITFVEEKAVITGYYVDDLGADTGTKIGDIITKINEVSVEEIVKENLKYIPASNYPTQLRDIASKLLRTNDDTIKIEYIRNGKTDQTELSVYSKSRLYNPLQLNKDYYQKIGSDIAYIYPGNIRNSDLPSILSEIQETKGLIIDLRSYPLDFIVFSLGAFLLPEPTEFVKFTIGSITDPGLFTMFDHIKLGEENNNYYKGKVIILINELTQSRAEFTTMAFRTAPRATVIGSTTAGADGNVSNFSLPGNISTSITGIGIYNPDGTETQRVGIVPDIVVTPTIEGIKENRDELLEKAIELINQEK